jgi:hypothetical protein
MLMLLQPVEALTGSAPTATPVDVGGWTVANKAGQRWRLRWVAAGGGGETSAGGGRCAVPEAAAGGEPPSRLMSPGVAARA